CPHFRPAREVAHDRSSIRTDEEVDFRITLKAIVEELLDVLLHPCHATSLKAVGQLVRAGHEFPIDLLVQDDHCADVKDRGDHGHGPDAEHAVAQRHAERARVPEFSHGRTPYTPPPVPYGAAAERSPCQSSRAAG